MFIFHKFENHHVEGNSAVVVYIPTGCDPEDPASYVSLCIWYVPGTTFDD